MRLFLLLVPFAFGCAHVERGDARLNAGASNIRKMAGCYLVDYNYTETEGLKNGYQRDSRLYDVTRTKAVKEWIYAEEIRPSRLRLQHILFATGADGAVISGTMLKHQAEDWEFEAPYLYEFSGPAQWQVKAMPKGSGAWTRRVTNLDDGLRYQCAAPWSVGSEYPEWSCDNYAPIPGRETRDMGRKDYNTLQRSTRILVYGSNWLERQNNVKTSDEANARVALAKEAGKNWYVRLPDGECKAAREFVSARKEFWALLRDVWDEVLAGEAAFVEKQMKDKPPRFAEMQKVEERFIGQNLKSREVRERARTEIMQVIERYREPLRQASY